MVDRLAGYESGPDATVRALAAARARLDVARAVLVVEGVSDQIAVETTARIRGHDLTADGVVVMPIGGAQAIGRRLAELHRHRDDLVIGALCDAAEVRWFRRAILADDTDQVTERDELARRGCFVCDADLEDEFLRAAGPALANEVMIAEGDATAFATLTAQPQWRDAPWQARARRFIAAGSRRKHRYAAAFADALGHDRAPAPIVGALDHVLR